VAAVGKKIIKMQRMTNDDEGRWRCTFQKLTYHCATTHARVATQ
jgi:hypothetical protein